MENVSSLLGGLELEEACPAKSKYVSGRRPHGVQIALLCICVFVVLLVVHIVKNTNYCAFATLRMCNLENSLTCRCIL